MRILYMSVHEILEYDELKLLTELGHEVYSLGAYTQPGGEEHRKRPALLLPYDPHFIELALQYDRRKLHPEMLENIDAVIIMHEPSFIGYTQGTRDWHPDLDSGNWPLFQEFMKRGGRVIWRSIGQSVPTVEDKLRPWAAEGLEIVRYSPAESSIAGAVEASATIRFYKDPEIYAGWTGQNERVINFTQSLKQRGEHCGESAIRTVLEGFPSKVYGPGNEDLGELSGGLLTYADQLRVMQESRAYFYHGTYPASYTLSLIEAMMVGLPIVAVGPKRGNGYMFPNQQTYEGHQIVEHGVSGFVTDDLTEARRYVKNLLNDRPLAESISTGGRIRATQLFGRDVIAQQWKEFLG